LVVNKIRGSFNTLAIKAPGFGDRKKDVLEDIAIVTGGQVISGERGIKFDSVELSMLGSAKRVLATKDSTIIVDGKSKKADINKRITQLKNQVSLIKSKYDKEKLEERIAKLSGGVAIVKVGAATEVEQREKQHRTEDAILATKAAMEEGIVPGGGVALIRCIESLDSLNLAGDEETGVNIVRKSLEEPLYQIAQNAGQKGSVIVENVKKKQGAVGYNAETDKYGDMLMSGIVDPAKVTRSALQNAASAAALFLTTEAVIADDPEPKKEDGPMGGGMPPMGMGM